MIDRKVLEGQMKQLDMDEQAQTASLQQIAGARRLCEHLLANHLDDGAEASDKQRLLGILRALKRGVIKLDEIDVTDVDCEVMGVKAAATNGA